MSVPALLNHQGFLTDIGGVPVNGNVAMTFGIYATPTGGAPLWSENHAVVAVTAGVFHVVLGAVTPLPVGTFTGAEFWLQTTADGVDQLPRRSLASVPYAFRAAVADFAESGVSPWDVSGTDISRPSGNVGIGTASPNYPLDVAGSVNAGAEFVASSGYTGSYGTILSVPHYLRKRLLSSYWNATVGDYVDIEVPGNDGSGNRLRITSKGSVGIGTETPAYPLEVETAAVGTVAYFHSGATSGTNHACNGQALGVGAARNIGGYFAASGAVENHALVVPPGSGNVGLGTVAPDRAMMLEVQGTAKVIATPPPDLSQALYVESLSVGRPFDRAAIRGVGRGLLGTGVRGSGDGDGVGVWGTGGVGIVGETVGGLNRAAEFMGAVVIIGTLRKSSGGFRIDHPLDPESKYLHHSFVESPDMMNVYNGTITTDDKGEAVVVLPDYFEALNRDFRYQLTVIGQFAQAIVSSEIRSRQFTVRTDKPKVKVSWQVTGIRQDAYAKAYPILVEEEKVDGERGKFLHPEVFDRSPDERIQVGRRGGDLTHDASN